MRKINHKSSAVLALISLLIAFLMVFSFGCAKKEEKEIKIGAILPLTGQSGQYGQWIRDSLEMARQEINNQGGINGKKLLIIYEDDQADPKAAANAMQKFVTIEKVPIVFGSWASSCVLAQAPIAEKTHTPILAEAQSPKIRDSGDYIFRIQPDSRYYLKYLIPYVYNNLNVHTLAILYVNNDYGVDQAKVFEDYFKQLGGKVVFSEAFEQGTVDFRTQLSKIRSLKPQGVFIPAYTEAGYILRQARELGIKTQFIGSAPLENPDILKIAGIGTEGAIYPHHFDPESSDPNVQQFAEKYKHRFGREIEGYAALAYDGLYVIAHVLKQCGEDRECIKNAIYGVQNFPGVTGLTSFDDHGDVIKPIVIRTVKNGKFRTLWRPHSG
ncbi:MAG: hypothetical protein A2Y97_10865 [Nitrospirae bacterium RBG_13_39_12]|nr:MAG: hypothetical protein A2Y97_10865 [Nitrospirae bacterium RBG_13_39_12]